MTGALTRRGEDTDRYMEKKAVLTIKAEIGMVSPQAKECQGLLAITGLQEKGLGGFLLRASRRTNPTNILISEFWLP